MEKSGQVLSRCNSLSVEHCSCTQDEDLAPSTSERQPYDRLMYLHHFYSIRGITLAQMAMVLNVTKFISVLLLCFGETKIFQNSNIGHTFGPVYMSTAYIR